MASLTKLSLKDDMRNRKRERINTEYYNNAAHMEIGANGGALADDAIVPCNNAYIKKRIQRDETTTNITSYYSASLVNCRAGKNVTEHPLACTVIQRVRNVKVSITQHACLEQLQSTQILNHRYTILSADSRRRSKSRRIENCWWGS